MNPESAVSQALKALLPEDAEASVSLRNGRLTVIIETASGEISEQALRQAVARAAPGVEADFLFTGKAAPAKAGCGSAGERAPKEDPALNVSAKRILLVCSGKGGAGKSTVAAALALRLARRGLKVGFADADIHGPSAPTLFNLSGRPDSEDNKLLPKLGDEGVRVMSIGFLAPADKALAWRGPMASKTLTQLLGQTKWDADVLVIDMPPGTGDVQLSLAARLPQAEALIVTQPHPLSIADATRAAAFCRDARVKLKGVLANMAYLESAAGRYYPFGKEESVSELAATLGVRYYGALPLLIDQDRAHVALADLLPETLVNEMAG